MKIIILGSINMDLIAYTAHLPLAGQTLHAHRFKTVGGGKGANQAVACAKLQAPTLMIGCVGDDGYGQQSRESLQRVGVDVRAIATLTDYPTGVALITVSEENAQNTIIVVAGANHAVGQDQLDALAQYLETGDILLLQLEIPINIVQQALDLAKAKGAIAILDPAPVVNLPQALYALVDILTPNETEASYLVGYTVHDEHTAEKASQTFLAWGVKRVIIKLGAKGAYWHNGTRGQFVPVIPVKAIDTVGAGDAFNGGLASGLCEGLAWEQAIARAMKTAALSTTREGAQTAMPTRDEVV